MLGLCIHFSRNRQGLIRLETFESYTVAQDVATLNLGAAFSGYWAVGSNYTGYSPGTTAGIDSAESYTDGDAVGSLSGGTGWNGPWAGPSDTYTSPVPDSNSIVYTPTTGLDGFEGYADSVGVTAVMTPTGTLNYTGWADFDVMQGKVDLLGQGFHDLYPGQGLYMHLGGGGSSMAMVKTKGRVYLSAASQYWIEVAGSQYNPNTYGTNLLSLVFVAEGSSPTEGNLAAHDMAWFGASGPFLSTMIWNSAAAGTYTPGYYNVWLALRSTQDKYVGPVLKNLRVMSKLASVPPGYVNDPVEEMRAAVGNENLQAVYLPPNDPLSNSSGRGFIGPWATGI